MYQHSVKADDIAWTPLDFDGVSMRVLHTDGSTGGMSVMTKMAAGSTIPAHYHSQANETVLVIDGDFIENGVSFGPGAFFAGDAGTTHGPHSTRSGCTLLTAFSAPLDFHLV